MYNAYTYNHVQLIIIQGYSEEARLSYTKGPSKNCLPSKLGIIYIHTYIIYIHNIHTHSSTYIHTHGDYATHVVLMCIGGDMSIEYIGSIIKIIISHYI